MPEQVTEKPDKSSDDSSDAPPEPEYVFDGFDVEFSEKITLSSVGANKETPVTRVAT
jgi:hypothetical protein